MIVKDLIKFSETKIEQTPFSDLDKINMKRDCRHLLSSLLPCPFGELFLYHTDDIVLKKRKLFDKQFLDLLSGKPLAYILKKQSFYKSEFFVDSRVLIPRMETELLIEKVLKKFSIKDHLFFADFGTGSGCIVLSLLKEFLNSKALGVDKSQHALEVAKHNGANLGLESRINFFHSSIENFVNLAVCLPLWQTLDFVVANPPYIDKKAYIHPFVKTFEPEMALWANNEGLQFLLSWAEKALILLKPGGYYFFEFGDNQKSLLEAPLNQLFSEVIFLKDLQGIYRIAICRK